MTPSTKRYTLSPVNVLRSQAQPELIHVLLEEREAAELVNALRKSKSHTAEMLRKDLKKVLSK